MALFYAVVRFLVTNDGLYRLASFEQPALFICQQLVFVTASILDLSVVLVRTPVALVFLHHFGLDAHSLRLDGATLN